jgi:hypothetical protein
MVDSRRAGAGHGVLREVRQRLGHEYLVGRRKVVLADGI